MHSDQNSDNLLFATGKASYVTDEPQVSDSDDQECAHQPLLLLTFKLVLVGVIGASIALLSIANNLILLYTFLSSKRRPERNLTYLTCLSFCDLLISIFYMTIMSVQVYAEFFEYFPLFAAWHDCLPILFTLSNVTSATGSFLLVAATIERYLQTMKSARSIALCQKMREHRHFGVFLAVMIGIIFRGSIFFEIETYRLPHCTGLSSMGVVLSQIASNPYYDSIWRFWIRRIVTIFLPFFVLAYCNSAILYSVQSDEAKDQRVKTLMLFLAKGTPRKYVQRPFRASIQKSPRVRSATRMLIAVVSCYLIANLLDVILATWEYIDGESLAEMSAFYTVATDISSLLSVLNKKLYNDTVLELFYGQ
ncbi:7 transmembrane receptor (rhodopsin family) domain-containing protein [Ditylenchus destructor]|nr:7 transmembrane receptor (rhodopsin family) domain-containing protein [Ditylenchus destructor]